jgi:hypothetical protein
MSTESFPRLVLLLVGFGVAGYFGFNVYSQPERTYRQIEPIRAFLNSALAHDTAALAMQAEDEQPIRWVLEATRLDSLAVREWAVSRPRVDSALRGDTLWVTLRRPGSTARCSPLYPLAAGFLESSGRRRLIHLSSSCPSEDRTVGSACPAGWTGRWEYRQKAGDGYDEEGERLELSCRAGSLAGLYYGLEREGEHGLFYTLTEVRNLQLSPEGELSFTVPGRALFHQRPATLQEVEHKKLASAGFTRDELHMKGKLQGTTLSLSCTSQAISCPEDVMVFRRAP